MPAFAGMTRGEDVHRPRHGRAKAARRTALLRSPIAVRRTASRSSPLGLPKQDPRARLCPGQPRPASLRVAKDMDARIRGHDVLIQGERNLVQRSRLHTLRICKNSKQATLAA
jgi:hypothetical protein